MTSQRPPVSLGAAIFTFLLSILAGVEAKAQMPSSWQLTDVHEAKGPKLAEDPVGLVSIGAGTLRVP